MALTAEQQSRLDEIFGGGAEAPTKEVSREEARASLQRSAIQSDFDKTAPKVPDQGFFSSVLGRAKALGTEIIKDPGSFAADPTKLVRRELGAATGELNEFLGRQIEKGVEKLPEFVKAPIREKGKELLASEAGQSALQAFQEGGEAFARLEESNPSMAQDIKDFANIIDLVPGVKTAAVGKKLAGETLEVGAVQVKKELTDLAKGQVKKSAVKRNAKTLEKAISTYDSAIGVNKTQTRLMEEFKGRFDEDISKYLVEHSIPLHTTDKGTKFATKQAAEEFRKETLGFIDGELDNVLQKWKGAKMVNLDDMKTAARDAINAENLPGITAEQRVKLIDDIITPEITKFGNIVDIPTANKIKRNLWKLGFEVLSPQKKPTARKIGQAIRQRIEDVVDSPIVKALNNEEAKVLTASDFLEKISGQSVRGGRLGKSLARVVGTVAGSQLGLTGALISGEALAMIVSKIGDVSRLSEKAIKQLRKSGVIPSSVQTTEDARDFLRELIKFREEQLLLPEAPLRMPALRERGQSGVIKDTPDAIQGEVVDFSKATVPKTVGNLAEEAKKFDSAEEFVSKHTPMAQFTTEGKEGKFWTTPEGADLGFGDIRKDAFVNESVLFKGQSSYDFVERKGLLTDKLKKTLEATDESDDPNQFFKITQDIAEDILKKEGYPGVHWRYEDDLNPTQYQIWDKSVVKTKSQLEQIWKEANKE